MVKFFKAHYVANSKKNLLQTDQQNILNWSGKKSIFN